MAADTQLAAPQMPALDTDARRERGRRRGVDGRALLTTSFTIILLALFLSPLLRTLTLSLKSADQITTIGAPIWPADPGTFEWQGEEYDVYLVPLPDGTTKELALVDPGRQSRTARSSPGRGRGGPSSSRGSSPRNGATSPRSGHGSTSRG
jgi:multiple sugar transport system permease protein